MTDPIADLCARMHELEQAGSGWGMPVIRDESIDKTAGRVVAALERLARERDELRTECSKWHHEAGVALERAERAEAERDALRECIDSADARRKIVSRSNEHLWGAYDAARAKVPK